MWRGSTSWTAQPPSWFTLRFVLFFFYNLLHLQSSGFFSLPLLMLPECHFHPASSSSSFSSPSSSSPSAMSLHAPSTTSLSWVRSPWCQADLEGRIGGGGGGEALYSAGWCGSSLFSPPRRPSWDAASRNTLKWCLNLCGRRAVGHGRSPLSPAVGSNCQFPANSPRFSFTRANSLLVSSLSVSYPERNSLEWKLGRHGGSGGGECWPGGHSLLLHPKREEVNSIKS